MSLAGEPDGPPTKAGISYVDHSGGITAALGVCAALVERVAYRDRHARRPRPLRRADLDAHLPRVVAAQPRRRLRAHRELRAPVAGAGAELPHRRRPSRALRRQRRHVATVRATRSAIRRWRTTRFATPRGSSRTPRRGDRPRPARAPRAPRAASGRCASARSGVACGTVNDVAGALAEPQTRARGLLVQNEHPAYGALRARPRTAADPGPRHLRPAPLLGEHTARPWRDRLPARRGSHDAAGAVGRSIVAERQLARSRAARRRCSASSTICQCVSATQVRANDAIASSARSGRAVGNAARCAALMPTSASRGAHAICAATSRQCVVELLARHHLVEQAQRRVRPRRRAPARSS